MKGTITRVILSAVAIIVYGVVNGILHPVQAILVGQMAGRQFESNDWTYVQTITGMNLVSYIGIPSIVLFLLLVWIWWKPISILLKQLSEDDSGPKLLVAGLIASGLFFGASDNANAYFEKVDTTEVYYILPNETAFWVPSQGDRMGNQASLNTAEYFDKNKVSTMLFKIPHMKLSGLIVFLGC